MMSHFAHTVNSVTENNLDTYISKFVFDNLCI